MAACCGALRPCLGSWEGRISHCALNSAQCNRRAAATPAALSSRFVGVKLVSTNPGRHSFNESLIATEPMKVECRIAEPDYDISSSDEYWSRIAAQYQSQPTVDVCELQVTSIPERGTMASSERGRSKKCTVMVPFQEENQIDWRSFRAKLCSAEAIDPDSGAWDSTEVRHHSKQWAHRLSTPEVGCVLIATENLNHHGFLRGTVILVLGFSLNSNHCHGIILNKKMSLPAHARQGADQRVLLDLPSCPKYVGGPVLSTPEINVLSGRTKIRGFRSLMPGLAVGGEAALPTLVSAVDSGEILQEEIHVYVGEVEWESRHLLAEVEVFEWWDVAACGSETLFETPPDQLRQTLLSLLCWQQ